MYNHTILIIMNYGQVLNRCGFAGGSARGGGQRKSPRRNSGAGEYGSIIT
jgi:hypothetical protein